jgi:excisionase family DNA binding protein
MAQGGSNRLLRIPEAAEYLNVKDRTLREHWQRWGLQAHRIGRAIMFRERELERFIDSKAERAA